MCGYKIFSSYYLRSLLIFKINSVNAEFVFVINLIFAWMFMYTTFGQFFFKSADFCRWLYFLKCKHDRATVYIKKQYNGYPVASLC